MSNQTVGILLAGGMSRRFGTPKAFQDWNGIPFYEYVYTALQAVCDDIIIVTRPQLKRRFPDKYHTVVDEEVYAGCGPLAGIFTGMHQKEADQYIVLPCDMPLINGDIMRALFRKHQLSVTVVRTKEELQPLVSIWDKTCEPILENALIKQQYGMKKLLTKLQVHTVSDISLTGEPGRFMNINTTRQLKEMTEWLMS
ncbi:MAG TPA: molybdenum cofactor guanylyltransferase [Pseudogracilibacillus sp.]|nr:molybdenum cofactor guanylyltransferase [Pseudogracilibacillus sp.]